MWTWSLNWGDIARNIVIGSCPMTPDDLATIRDRTGASALLSLQHDDCLAYWNIDYADMVRTADELGLVMSRTPIRDFDIPDMRRCLPDAVTALHHLLSAGHRTYVHCTAGLGRAPLTVLGYLAIVKQMDPEEAIRLIHRGRPDAVPAWEAFHGCREDLTVRHNKTIQKSAFKICQEGRFDNARADWCEAQSEVLSAALI